MTFDNTTPNERRKFISRFKQKAQARKRQLERARALAREQYQRLGDRINRPLVPPAS